MFVKNRWGVVRVGMKKPQVIHVVLHHRRFMMDTLQALSLLGIIACQFVLIRGCFKIHHELPAQGGNISEKIDGVNDVLNELADFVADLARNGLFQAAQSHTPPDFMTLLTAFLKRDTPSPSEHGSTQESQEWEVLPPNDTQTNETENELDQLGG